MNDYQAARVADSLRRRAQQVAEQRAPSQIEALRANVTPEDPDATPYHTQNQLATVGVFVPLDELAGHDSRDRRAAILWAATCDSQQPTPRPEWLPGRDRAECGTKVTSDRWSYGAPPAARQKFDDFWTEQNAPDEDPGESITDEQAGLLDILEQVAEIHERVNTLENYVRRILGLETDEEQDRDDTSVAAERVRNGDTE